MFLNRTRRNRKGFTIVELVIVIAVIAVLSAVLIPTFSVVIKNARRSNDQTNVRQMNDALVTEFAANPPASYEEAKAALCEAGFTVPCLPETEDCRFFWIPAEDRVVLFDLETETVTFPEALADVPDFDEWIDLAEGLIEEPEESEDLSKPEESSESSESPTDPDLSGLSITLKKGKEFRKTITGVCANPTKIIFGKPSDYPGFFEDGKVKDGAFDKTKNLDGVPKKANESSNAWYHLNLVAAKGTEVYILSELPLKANSDCNGLFKNFASLKSVEFGNLDTSGIKNAEKMFYGCSSLQSLDLSGWDVSSIDNTTSMFEDCYSLKNIYVETEDTVWLSSSQVKKSQKMFASCSKLPHYTEGSAFEDIWNFFYNMFSPKPKATHDVTFANTGETGYLTEKQP